MKKSRFLFTGGGTGGHVYPNIAIYEALKEKYPEAEFMYIGSKKGSEASIVPALEQPMRFVTVPTKGLPQNLKSAGALVSLGFIFLGAVKSFFILRKFRADVIIGSGGYVAAPVLLAAALLKQKVFIHEQNAVPGRLNLFVARFATRIGVAFPSSAYFFPAERVVCTGYPLRKSILSAHDENVRAKFNIPRDSRVLFICSGSMGARTINRAAAAIMPRLLALPNLFIIMSTGKAYGKEYKAYDDTVRILEQNGCLPEIAGKLLVKEYFDPIAEIYAVSDLVVSRAGAGAIKEITTMGLPSVLIPKINLPADHQILNAREVEKSGGARILYEEISSQGKTGRIFIPPDVFFHVLQELLEGNETLAMMRQNIGRQDSPNSTALIVETIESIIEKKDGAREKELRLFYLQALDDEKNLELPFTATTVGNTFWADIRLENVPGRALFEIKFLDREQNKAVVMNRAGDFQLNGKKIAGWVELRDDDRIAVNGRSFIFKSYLEKIKAADCRSSSCQRGPGPARSTGILISCLGGLGRAIVNAAVFGAGIAMDVFSVAWAVAGFMRRGLGENTAQNTLLPVFQSLFRNSPRKKAWEAASTMINFTLLISLLICAAGIVFAPLAVRLLFPGFAARGLLAETTAMTRILFPCLITATLAAVMSAYLRTFGKYAPAVAAPIVFSLGSIAGMLLLLPGSGFYALAYGLLIGGLLQIVFLLPFLLKTLRQPELEFAYRPAIKIKGVPFRKFVSRLPSLVSDSFLRQGASVGEKILASSLAKGSLSYLYFAMEIFRLPFALISHSIAKVVLRDFSAQTALFDNEKTKTFFIDGIRITLFLLAPISILALVLANPLVSLLLERFSFSAPAAANTALALQYYAIGLIGWGIHALTTRIFAERQEGKTAARLDFFMLVFNILLVSQLIKTPLKFAGVALATSISYLTFAAVGVLVLRRKLNRGGDPLKASEIFRALLKTLCACLLMVIAIVEAKFVFNSIHFNSRVSENLILCVSLSFMGTAVYFLSSLVFKNSGILFFKNKNSDPRNQVPVSLLSPSRFLEVASVNPEFFKNEYRYKINIYLSHSAWQVRNIGLKLIGLFKEKSKGAYLFDLLAAGQSNGFMRRNALQALKAVNFWNPEVKDLLLRMLKDPYFEVRVAALEMLGENISEAEYADIRRTILRKLRRGMFEEKTACLRLIARKGLVADLAPLRPLYLDSNSPIREELLELLYVFYRRGLLNGAEIKKQIEQVLITSNHLAPEFKVKSIIKRIYREIDQT
jgi:murein biosynthesis integral membrane protein MurJ/undecaprenyldiphospho-muramoylpentapeptide beta-N-acetylglucosaminyltransferase